MVVTSGLVFVVMGGFHFLGGILAEGKHQRWWLIGFSYEMNQS